jgi:hypothetical protein
MVDLERLMHDAVTPGEAIRAGKKIPPDAIEILKLEHRDVLWRLGRYAELSPAERESVLRYVALSLLAHMDLEEELFYPPAAVATGNEGLIKEAVEEHAEVRGILGDLDAAATDSERGPLVRKLSEALEEHVLKEEEELFPSLREAGFDALAVGSAMAARRVACFAELTGKPAPSLSVAPL